jgi:hypothetical protein
MGMTMRRITAGLTTATLDPLIELLEVETDDQETFLNVGRVCLAVIEEMHPSITTSPAGAVETDEGPAAVWADDAVLDVAAALEALAAEADLPGFVLSPPMSSFSDDEDGPGETTFDRLFIAVDGQAVIVE